MTTLLNGRDTKITGGEYVYQAIVTTGDITLSMRLDDNAFTPIPDGVISAT